MTSTPTAAEPAPVFVDRTGQRGRRLRGLGWLVGIVCAGCVVAMISGLVGTQSQAPALTVPRTADTKPPHQYLNAPLPAAPGAAEPSGSATATAGASDATVPVTATTPAGASGATATVTPTTPTTPATASDATVPITATTPAVPAAPGSATAAAQ
ncbi:hypothetical protein ACFY93_22200 [Streptomyces sp. NPDC008313]|uniref:hypothetical protein n=1 Tax=Streptomyces sp. NPDC008313 TaxID=3364826 RepID=UPI0036EF3E4A